MSRAFISPIGQPEVGAEHCTILVRRYQPPVGQIADMPLAVASDVAAGLRRLAAADIHPAVEFLRTGQVSVTLEDDEYNGMDCACEIVDLTHITDGLSRIVRLLVSSSDPYC